MITEEKIITIQNTCVVHGIIKTRYNPPKLFKRFNVQKVYSLLSEQHK
jgi:hypothetical protein